MRWPVITKLGTWAGTCAHPLCGGCAAHVEILPVEEFAREFQVSTIYQPVPDEFLDQVVAESLKLPARVWRAAMAGMLAADHTAQLGHIQMPTLILWGDQDAIFSRAAQDRLVAGLARAVLRVYPETGHALHWEQPEQFVRDLEDYIPLEG